MASEEMLQREEEAWRSFAEAFGSVSPDRRNAEGVVRGWSTHDLVWHCGFWATHAADVMEQIRAGKPEPEEPDYAVLEPKVLSEGRARSWEEAVAHAERGRQRARAAFSGFDDPPPEAVEWFTAEAVEHYADHAGQIRQFVASG